MALSRHRHLEEFNAPLVTNTGILTAAQRKALVLTNLGLTADATEINTILEGNTATAAEITRAADVSTRNVTIVATGDVTELLHEGKTNILAEVGGNAIVTLTLPAATGGGGRYRFVVGVVNTSSYVIQKAGSDVFSGYALIWDMDGTTLTAFDAVGTSSSDVFTFNGTTTGGARIGDWVEFEDILSGIWAVRAFGHCPTSSNPATPFA